MLKGPTFSHSERRKKNLGLHPLPPAPPHAVDVEHLGERFDAAGVRAGQRAVLVDPIHGAIDEVDLGMFVEKIEDAPGGVLGEEVVAIDEADDVAAHPNQGAVQRL